MKPELNTREAGYDERTSRVDVKQLFSIIGGPLAVLAALQAKYAVAQLWGCASVTANVVNHVVAFASLLLALGAAILARRQWRDAGREVPGDHDGADGRTRTMAAIGVGLSLMSAAVIVAQWLPQVMLHPCLQ
jgi:hypothetical protein